jgi:hypothetical protein
MALSPNYGFPEPDNSSLVKNGAQDIRALGDAVDTAVWNVGFGQAGKNKIINGNFGIWQRGTSFTTNAALTADRFKMVTTAAQGTVSQQTFAPGAAPVAGYEAQYFLRYNATASNLDPRILQEIEDVRTFAGQTVTVSFWAKSATSDALSNVSFRQTFGSGGSAQVDTTSSAFTLTSSWARYSATLSIPSITGKTIGANSSLRLTFDLKDSAAFDFDVWGVQVEAGSKATPFQLAGGGDPQSELAMCQRYYWRRSATSPNSVFTPFASGATANATTHYMTVQYPVPMRTAPSSVEFLSVSLAVPGGTGYVPTAISLANTGEQMTLLTVTTASSVYTIGQATALNAGNTNNSYLGMSAEL